MSVAQMILDRIEGQNGSHKTEQGPIVSYDLSALPQMKETSDWNLSATGQWSRDELIDIREAPISEWVSALTDMDDPWLNMGVISELIMHGEERRARELTQNLLSAQPAAERALEQYFGREIVGVLKSPMEQDQTPES